MRCIVYTFQLQILPASASQVLHRLTQDRRLLQQIRILVLLSPRRLTHGFIRQAPMSFLLEDRVLTVIDQDRSTFGPSVFTCCHGHSCHSSRFDLHFVLYRGKIFRLRVEILWKSLCLLGRLSLNSLQSGINANSVALTLLIFLCILQLNPQWSNLLHICFQSVFPVPLVQFTLQFSAVHCSRARALVTHVHDDD